MEEREIHRLRETRLGIVMYDGESLVVYKNGVAQELFLAVRDEVSVANRGSAKPTSYSLREALADTEIFVDIVSGASADGINGMLLANPLANGIWRFEASSYKTSPEGLPPSLIQHEASAPS